MTAEPDVISRQLARARERIRRYPPEEAVRAVERGALLVDLRPLEYRLRFGEIPGAVAVSRHVLEWRLDVSSEWRLKELAPADTDREIILICNEGYTSSLAAWQVTELLGLREVADVTGGFAAWRAAGLPVTPRLARTGPAQHT
ncbi:rhodanese-like domain-containing protein [Amycolatopsis cihanbeyliensis]|uniref:Rhodanese-related sulfurtransferase n=1 Tax=Amycolatopsis cihanbeyliensis TaxID=1128664 RepID=A0A542CSW9_AMYCI|nr:rhodanese-like domain-containing protein [Amycolatopsis cihanbeyliensis]TQI93928.1 rhodanese-related sulfurtransferase [Amycolatopsis cihanbeyliensis]